MPDPQPTPTYFLAFDHRGEFARSVFDRESDGSAAEEAEITALKEVVYAGLREAAGSPRLGAGRAGLLVDELYGAGVARAAKEGGLVLAMPVEKPDCEVFEFAYGESFGDHVAAFGPAYAKVLVRYNVETEAASRRIQVQHLKVLSDWLREREHRLLLELLVPPTPGQLAAAGGERREFEVTQRPALARDAIAELQSGGVVVDLWKLEGIDDEAEAAATVAQARAPQGAEDALCTVLGAGADKERVARWLTVAARTDGFAGFAIGRSIWREPLRAVRAGELRREEAMAEIAEGYLGFVDVYEAAVAAPQP